LTPTGLSDQKLELVLLVSRQRVRGQQCHFARCIA
jgi:hypothetical protein